jgi:hypothetical protein
MPRAAKSAASNFSATPETKTPGDKAGRFFAGECGSAISNSSVALSQSIPIAIPPTCFRGSSTAEALDPGKRFRLGIKSRVTPILRIAVLRSEAYRIIRQTNAPIEHGYAPSNEATILSSRSGNGQVTFGDAYVCRPMPRVL